jgi:hypothetical protein
VGTNTSNLQLWNASDQVVSTSAIAGVPQPAMAYRDWERDRCDGRFVSKQRSMMQFLRRILVWYLVRLTMGRIQWMHHRRLVSLDLEEVRNGLRNTKEASQVAVVDETAYCGISVSHNGAGHRTTERLKSSSLSALCIRFFSTILVRCFDGKDLLSTPPACTQIPSQAEAFLAHQPCRFPLRSDSLS